MARVVGSLRLQRLRGAPRHRGQRDPQRGGAHRRVTAVQVPGLGTGRAASWWTGSSPATRPGSAAGQVFYTPWCDEHGKVIDDGTVSRLDDDSYRWTAADPQLRWLRLNGRGLDVTVEEISERVASLALQGPLSRDVLEAATGESFADLRYFRRRASRIGDIDIDVSRTGYTGDLGYELWLDAARAERPLGRAHGDRSWLCAATGGHACPGRGPGRSRPHPARGRLHLLDARAHPGAELLARRDRPGSPRRAGQGRRRSWARRRCVERRRRAVRHDVSWASTSTGPTSNGSTPHRT